jgi:predicted phosphodiesterase
MDVMELVRNATKIVLENENRPLNIHGVPGGLLDFTKIKQKPIIVGDLHTNLENLKMILNHNGNIDNLKNGNNVLIIIGDAIHNDQSGCMLEMGSSLVIIEYIFNLIITYPKRVIYIRGNHDTFDDRLRKNGIAQGTEFKKLLIKERGEEYFKAVEKFFESLPMFIIGDGYMITHAGPPRGGITRDELINISDYPDKYLQLMWNRIHEFRGTPSAKEYSDHDINITKEKLGLPTETAFIVGHNPLWNTGGTTGVWSDVLGIKNHHILYSGSGSQAPYLVKENGELSLYLAFVPKKEVYNYV